MKIMKKWLAIGLAVAMLTGLSACGMRIRTAAGSRKAVPLRKAANLKKAVRRRRAVQRRLAARKRRSRFC